MITLRIGLSVTLRIFVKNNAAKEGVPKASKTITPSSVTMKPALEIKPSLSVAIPALLVSFQHRLQGKLFQVIDYNPVIHW
jgi:hypothetical protein